VLDKQFIYVSLVLFVVNKIVRMLEDWGILGPGYWILGPSKKTKTKKHLVYLVCFVV
jgi:hypothetical protein